jgi:hypothetical protein
MADSVHQDYGNNISDLVNEMVMQSYPGLEISAPMTRVGFLNNVFCIQSLGIRVGLQFTPPSLALILWEEYQQ